MIRWHRGLLTLGFSVPVIALLAFGMTRDPRALPSTLPGRPAPDFELAVLMESGPTYGSPTATLAAHRGEVVVLNFWASWCVSCRSEHPHLSRVAERYTGRGVHFYGVLYSDRAPNAVRYIRDRGGQSYPTLLDPGTRTAIDYGLYGVPETFFIGRDGIVAHKHVGPVSEALLVEWIERLLADVRDGA
jgi:cytochrome c biogenesis protein CcmG, thiol:disulfide interchange protein DsbE